MSEQPQFRTVLRGFDPDQVTEVVKELDTSLVVARRTASERTAELAHAQQELHALRAELKEARSRADQAPPAPEAPAQTYGDLGGRIGTMLSLAEEEATQMRDAAKAEAKRAREDADADAMRMRSAAQASADEIVQRATDEVASRRQKLDADLADDLSRHEARLTDLRGQADRLRATLDEARGQAHGESQRIIEQARAEAEQLRRDSAAELAEAAAHRDRIHAHLGQVHQALADLIASGLGSEPAAKGERAEGSQGADRADTDGPAEPPRGSAQPAPPAQEGGSADGADRTQPIRESDQEAPPPRLPGPPAGEDQDQVEGFDAETDDDTERHAPTSATADAPQNGAGGRSRWGWENAGARRR